MKVLYSCKNEPAIGEGIQDVYCFSFVMVENEKKKMLNVSGEEFQLFYDVPYKEAKQIIETAAKTDVIDLRKYEPFDYSMGHSASSEFLDTIDVYDYMYGDEEADEDEDDDGEDNGIIPFLPFNPSNS